VAKAAGTESPDLHLWVCYSMQRSLKRRIFGAHTKRLLDKTSPLQNVSIQNVYTHKVSLTKRLLNETSPVTKRLHNKTSPRQQLYARLNQTTTMKI
jgi:hypothetical protein